MRSQCFPLFVLCVMAIGVSWNNYSRAASRLEGDVYTVSLTNFPGDVGVTIDPVSLEEHNHGAPVSVTFDGIAEVAGGMRVNERVSEWAGVVGGIPVVQAAGIDGETEFDLIDWELPGEILEFGFETVDGDWISDEPLTHGFQTLAGLDWRSSRNDSEPAFFETGFYFYYSRDGQPIAGYETMLPQIGLLVGDHPFDASVPEVVYIGYSQRQVEEVVERYAGGTDFNFGSTQLDDDASYALLAEVVGLANLGTVNGRPANGFHIGILVEPPAAMPILGDVNLNGLIDIGDIDDLSLAIRQGLTGARYDLNGNGTVEDTDRDFWVEQVARTYYGDSNFDKVFDSGDFVVVFVAAQYEDNVAGNSTWATGDWDGNRDFDSSDFVFALSHGGYESGPRAAVAAVPEPTGSLGLTLLLAAAVPLLRRNSRSRSGTK